MKSGEHIQVVTTVSSFSRCAVAHTIFIEFLERGLSRQRALWRGCGSGNRCGCQKKNSRMKARWSDMQRMENDHFAATCILSISFLGGDVVRHLGRPAHMEPLHSLLHDAVRVCNPLVLA
jgi:hypothetical protein